MRFIKNDREPYRCRLVAANGHFDICPSGIASVRCSPPVPAVTVHRHDRQSWQIIMIYFPEGNIRDTSCNLSVVIPEIG